jgi:hypothetical protein
VNLSPHIKVVLHIGSKQKFKNCHTVKIEVI